MCWIVWLECSWSEQSCIRTAECRFRNQHLFIFSWLIAERHFVCEKCCLPQLWIYDEHPESEFPYYKKQRTHTFKNIFIGNEYNNVLTIFQHSHHQNWDTYRIEGSTFVSPIVEVCVCEWNQRVIDVFSSSSLPKRALEDRNFLRCKKTWKSLRARSGL